MGDLPPQQLVAKPWSVPVLLTDALTRATAASGGAVAWASSGSEAAGLAKDLQGCDGALALVTRKPIAKPPAEDGSSTGVFPHTAGVPVLMLRPNPAPLDGSPTPAPRQAFMDAVVTQLGSRAVIHSRSPGNGSAAAPDPLPTGGAVLLPVLLPVPPPPAGGWGWG